MTSFMLACPMGSTAQVSILESWTSKVTLRLIQCKQHTQRFKSVKRGSRNLLGSFQPQTQWFPESKLVRLMDNLGTFYSTTQTWAASKYIHMTTTPSQSTFPRDAGLLKMWTLAGWKSKKGASTYYDPRSICKIKILDTPKHSLFIQ